MYECFSRLLDFVIAIIIPCIIYFSGGSTTELYTARTKQRPSPVLLYIRLLRAKIYDHPRAVASPFVTFVFYPSGSSTTEPYTARAKQRP